MQIWLTASSLAVACLSILATLIEHRFYSQLNRTHTREKQVLLQSNSDLTDRIMHMAGNTWTPPPRVVEERELSDEEKQAMIDAMHWKPV